MALTELYYIKPFGVTCWWFKGLLFVVCMVASIVVFGGLVVALWYLCERRDSNNENCVDEGDEKNNTEKYNKLMAYPNAYQTTIASLTSAKYGRRPDFEGKTLNLLVLSYFICICLEVLFCWHYLVLNLKHNETLIQSSC